MPKYLHQTEHGINGYDTDALQYPNLPPRRELVEADARTWKKFLKNPHGLRLQGKNLVEREPPAPPPLTRPQRASQILVGGVILECASNPTLNGTYLAGDSQWAAMNTELHIGESPIDWPDISGAIHSFSLDEFSAFTSAIARWRSAWRKFSQGLVDDAPPASISIP